MTCRSNPPSQIVAKERIQVTLKRNIEKVEEIGAWNDRNDNDDDILQPPPIVLQDHIMASSQGIIKTQPPKQDEYTTLLKATIEETLYTMKHTSSSSSSLQHASSQQQQQQLYDNQMKKRPKIEETEHSEFDHVDTAQDGAVPTVSLQDSKKHKGLKVEYLDADAKYEQMRLIHSLNPSPPKLFMFSGTSLSDRDWMTDEITRLGGSCSHDQTWDPNCTHLIISKIIKTEKFLAACASCCWILKADFIDASKNTSKWADESVYAISGHGTFYHHPPFVSNFLMV